MSTHTSEMPWEVDLVRVGDDYWQRVEGIEFRIFEEQGYSQSFNEHVRNYRPYDERSVTAIIIDRETRSVIPALTRFIVPHSGVIDVRNSGFKGVDDSLNESPWGKLDIWEGAAGWDYLQRHFETNGMVEGGTVGSLREHHGEPTIPFLLTSAQAALVLRRAERIGVDREHATILTSLDEKHYHRLKRVVGPALREIGDFADYGNSPTINVVVHIVAALAYDEEKRGSRRILRPEIITEGLSL